MRRRVRLGRYIVLFGVVAVALYFTRGRLKRTLRRLDRPCPDTMIVSQEPDSTTDLWEFPRVFLATDSMRGETLFLSGSRIALLGGGDRRLALSIVDTLLALEEDFDTIDLHIRGYAVLR
jgi:hypothetical protein